MPNRSKRLRKKLKTDEFVVLSFGIAIDLAADLAPAQADEFWNAWIADAVEANGLLYGGLNTGVATAEAGNTSDVQRQQLADWLKARPEVTRFKIGPLTDSNPPWLRRTGWADFDFETSLQLDTAQWVARG
jgi:uncharacterized protein YggL (DUF469 family)